MVGIYKITNPKGKVYIGQSVDIERRFKEYKVHLNFKNISSKLYYSLKKYGSENHVFEVVEECSLEHLKEREIYWKQYYLNQFNNNWKSLLFLELYDRGGGPRSEGTKYKISEGNKGKKKPNSGPKKQSITQYTLENEFVKEWNSAKEAALSINKRSSAITECCKQIYNRKSAYVFIWKLKT